MTARSPILLKAGQLLQANLTKEEFLEFFNTLDSDPDDMLFFDLVMNLAAEANPDKFICLTGESRE